MRARPSEPVLSPVTPFKQAQAALAHADSAGTEGRAEPERILIVEDEFLVAAQIESALVDAGYEVVGITSSGEEAIELAISHEPSLAVVDIRLAGEVDGIEVALALFTQRRIRCIFATAHADQDMRARAAPAAPLGWLQKPYSSATLLRAVRQALAELRRDSDG